MSTARLPPAAVALPVVLAMASATGAATVYVNATCGSDTWSGASPICASPDGPKETIKWAIIAASSGDEIVVADGVYTGPDNRNLGYGGKLLSLRSANGPEQCVIDCQGQGRAFVFDDDEPVGSLVEGFTIRGGAASEGGAVLCVANMAFENCVFEDNSAEIGGAIHHLASGKDLVLRDCRFVGNEGTVGPAAIFVGSHVLRIERCQFVGNTGNSIGAVGGIGYDVAIVNSEFVQNTAEFLAGGAAVLGWEEPFPVSNCTFSRNSAPMGAGFVVSESTVANCSFSANDGDGLYADTHDTVFVVNSVFWNNIPTQIAREDLVEVSYSDVQDGWPGEGNINENPLFASPASDDLRLTEGSRAPARGRHRPRR
jgi:hypothetical protein